MGAILAMTETLKLFNNLNAVVTGATRGIGFAIAARLIKEGARVRATGTKPEGAGPEGSDYVAIDFNDAEAIQDFADDLRQNAPDILINNAGINIIGPIADFGLDDFSRIQRVNVEAPFLLCRAVIPGMREKGWGRIVNISSIWGKISKAERAAYSASKFAIDGLTAALAAEVAGDGILANCVAPGFIETDLTREILSAKDMAALAAQVPVGRFGQPEEIAALVTWLAGRENTYVSGQNIAIDGGFSRV